MSAAATSAYICTPYGERMMSLGSGVGVNADTDFVSLTYTNTVNAVGAAILTAEVSQIPEYYLQPDWWLEITRSTDPAAPERIEGECRWRIDEIEEDVDRGTVAIGALASNILLGDAEVAYAAESSQALKTDQADDMLKAIVRENLGSTATDTDRRRSSDLFQVAADLGLGPSITKGFSRKPVLQVCQEIAATAAKEGVYLAFDVVWTGSIFELRTYINQRGADRSLTGPSPRIVEARDLGGVKVKRSWRQERSFIYAAGARLGADRDEATASSTSQLARSPWARKELTINASGQAAKGDTAALQAEADRGLYEHRAVMTLTGTLTGSPQLRYGIDWDLGDRLAFSHRGQTYDARVSSRRVTVQGGQERVEAQLRVEITL